MTAPPAIFTPSPLGHVRQWLIAGPREIPYTGPPGTEEEIRAHGLDFSPPKRQIEPLSATLGGPGPLGKAWRFGYPGNNYFQEFTSFYRRINAVEYYGYSELVADQAGDREARFWVAGTADLWVNGEHIAQKDVGRCPNPYSAPVTLPLRAGVNQLVVRLQAMGIRDTRILFGLTLADPRGVTLQVPSAAEIAAAAKWLDALVPARLNTLQAAEPPPATAEVTVCIYGNPRQPWPPGKTIFPFPAPLPRNLSIEVSVRGQVLQRDFELPGNRPAILLLTEDRRTAHLRYVAACGFYGQPAAHWNAIHLPLMARRLLGITTDVDASAFADCVALIDAREDCADFVLAGLLRMQFLGLATAEESAEIRRAALAFRYWSDEPGNDAMCFWSENHSLLFHGCMYLAGKLYPDAVFTNSGHTGRDQTRIAAERINGWLRYIEARGFEEFNSSTYMPITIAAMLNLADFSGEPELARRMNLQVDRIYRDIARHTFPGAGVITPQGRIYRDVLVPDEGGTQVLLAYATPAVEVNLLGLAPPRERTGNWVVFPASSTYQPPADLAKLINQPDSSVTHHADFQIILEKTPAYILTSLAVPAEPRPGSAPGSGLQPNAGGYQQHLWQATLGRDCHIWVNHPGGSYDATKSRPGYWYGNGQLPRINQRGRTLEAVYQIADGGPDVPRDAPFDLHPIPFTHAHWPADSFDREVRHGHWVFGQKGRGLIGLWCSVPLEPHNDILTNRELRAPGYRATWRVICGDTELDGDLAQFISACEEVTILNGTAQFPEFAKEKPKKPSKGY